MTFLTMKNLIKVIFVNIYSVKKTFALASILLLVLLSGCAQVPMGEAVPSIANIQKIKSIGMKPVALGKFSADKQKGEAFDTVINIRSNSLFSPYEKSFSLYLKETLSAELTAAGLLDASSSIVVSGVLLANKLDASGITEGTGKLSADFTVMKADSLVYRKTLTAESTWKSSFVGMIAIPAAINEYTQLYRSLVTKLLEDVEFHQAVRP
jgi:hypothetical protein